MSNRISTGMMYSQSVALMMAKQAKLSHLEQQIATGSKIVSAKDDPVAAGAAVGLDRSLAALERMKLNGNNVQNRLGVQENTLAQVNDLMARVNDLTIQASNPALSAPDKKTLITELNQIREGLLSLANSSDGTGRYVFGGTNDSDPPFAKIDGKVVYRGDQTQRQVEVGPDTYVRDALPGSEIFLRIPTGDGFVDGSAAAGNAGNGVLTNITRDGSDSWNGQSFSVRFTAADQYEVLDGAGNVTGTGTYKAGSELEINGVRLQIAGAPATGDSFNVQAASSRDIFGTMDKLIAALDADTGTPAKMAAQQNELQSALRDVGRAAERMIDSRAAGGAQLKALDNAAEMREANGVTLKTTLSEMRDLDYADALSQYQLESTALQAAQTLFSQMQSMSLFNKIR
ncbi:flagellar hook-associated protein FlgL [Stenotrophomonas indicatrix]|jgi:flagellar hook-associated protein 3 FlgL|uniref:Flagellar hook-associated protein 3 FlgL n=1 Tax=Stenotrophomonas indicatrix TaxID=2045451 RepID=A0A1W1GVQ1_9GAMM|nr:MULTISPECIES: flagellar hook-associated protein FlgL [Stenotrophomonas]EVT72433.1 flagellar hook-associated protein FlgL [Stenotrophomonas maltophilia 5BA-I-2]PJL12800.1 flagellar hook-associated protein 3 [Stenotrophomonas maltophilia]AVJ33182.1 flagellar hook-associated protein 3 [Stenotrophomonas sp. MYb57]MBA0098819.1 flagellar hook-associated protein FlgL [Stenotrophomonas indicatrix]MCK6231551.1 flagellar hook-associated protein FlgL [Stenotrophomonas indicatrix]